MRLTWRLALMLAMAIGLAFPRAVARAEQPLTVGDDCFAWATRADGSSYEGRGKSPQLAKADAISKCYAARSHRGLCGIAVGSVNCNGASQATNDHRFVDELREKKVSVWNFGLVGVVTHLLWLWHFSQKTLAKPAKAGLGAGVTVIQAALLYLLGGDGEIGLLELPIFVLPLGLGELVASVSFKTKSE
jgi:hypothetical protein